MNLERYKYNFLKRIFVETLDIIKSIPNKIKHLFITKIPNLTKRLILKIKQIFNLIYQTFKEGNIYTRLSYFIMGIGHF